MAHHITKDVEARVRAYVDTLVRDIPVSAVYVFGSQANGSAHAESDIDIAVISPSFGEDAFVTGSYLQKKLWDSPYKNMDVVGYSPEDFAMEDSPLIAEIKNNGVMVV